MIKKLDKLILKAFIGPFIATFFITLFVLVLQFFWLYIDDIVGKNIDFLTIFQLVGWLSATLVTLAIPLAVLLSSIMTFGNLGETFELVAIKSAGIPLFRFMRPLLITSLFICGISFLFNNYIIPIATLKLNSLKYDIIIAKPAFDIKEGVFYDKLEGYVIKIGKKNTDGSLKNVIIYEKNYNLQDNITVADSGRMKVSDDKRFLEFYLYNGSRYEEKGQRGTTSTDYTRLSFKDYKKIFDLSSFRLPKTADSVFKDNWKMLSIRQLNKAIDSLEKNARSYGPKMARETMPVLLFQKYLDSSWAGIKPGAHAPKSFNEIISDSVRRSLLELSIAEANSAKSTFEINSGDYVNKRKDLRYHLIEWHRKFTMSIACLVLFLIGAPLGSIIRKGGIGTPLIFAVVFFVIFFLLNNFGEKFVKQDVMQPLSGMWLATVILLPIGIFLISKAMRDSQLFNQEFYFRSFRSLQQFLKTKK